MTSRVLAALSLLAFGVSSWAAYPEKPIRFIVSSA
jgi:tripartite-type tricarboxylate transporter receptor subunit TctC